MDYREKMDEFIKAVALQKTNIPTLELSSRRIYANLMMYGVESRESCNEFFADWQNNLNGENLKVEENPRQKGFLQFFNPNYKVTEYNFAKLYMHFGKEDLKYCAQEIFSFLKKENIKHFSKIADSIRADNLVLRIEHLSDVEKIENFIRSRSDINSKMKPVNPFLFTSSNIGFAYDEMLSFNTILSDVLEGYFKARNDNLNKCSIDDFHIFATQQYNERYVSLNRVDEVLNNQEFNDFSVERHGDKFEALYNHAQVERLIACMTGQSFTMEKYKEQLSETRNKDYRNNYCNYFKSKLQTKEQVVDKNEMTMPNSTTKDQIIAAYIMHANNKYGEGRTNEYLQQFAFSGNYNCITRDQGLRDKFIQYITKEDVSNLMKSGRMDQVLRNARMDRIKSKTPYDKLKLFEKAVKETFRKYGYYQTRAASIKAVYENSFTGFTQEYTKGLRDELRNTYVPRELEGMLKAFLTSINQNNNPEFIDQFLNIVLEDELKKEGDHLSRSGMRA